MARTSKTSKRQNEQGSDDTNTPITATAARLSVAISIVAVLVTVVGTWYQSRQVELMREQLDAETSRWDLEGEVLALSTEVVVYTDVEDGRRVVSHRIDEGHTISAEDIQHPNEVDVILTITNTGRGQGLVREIGVVAGTSSPTYHALTPAELFCPHDKDAETISIITCDMPIPIEASSQVDVHVTPSGPASAILCNAASIEDGGLSLYVKGIKDEPYAVSTTVGTDTLENCPTSP